MEVGKGAKGLKTKLIVNYLPQSMTDGEFNSLFSAIGPLESCKIMRDRTTNYSFGYGFVDYTKPLDAETAIGKLNGYKVVNKTLRVAYSKPPGSSTNVNLYISGLTANIDENNLQELFSPYGELVHTRILRNADGSSKSVGFVLFKDKDNADAAIRDLQDHSAGDGMKLHIKYAKDSSDQEKKHPKFQEYLQHKFMQQNHPMYNQGMGMGGGTGYQQLPSQQMGYRAPYGGGCGVQVGYGVSGDGGQKAMRGREVSSRFNPLSRPLGGAGVSGGGGGGGGTMDGADATTLFCYLGEGDEASDAILYALFSKFGRITKVDVVAGTEGYGIVHMGTPGEANEALKSLNGSFYKRKVIQVSKNKKT